jgi:hypothetical protein
VPHGGHAHFGSLLVITSLSNSPTDRQVAVKKKKKRLGRREKGSADHVRRVGIGGFFSVGRVRVSRTAGHLNAEESQESARHHGKWRVAVESALFRVAGGKRARSICSDLPPPSPANTNLYCNHRVGGRLFLT